MSLRLSRLAATGLAALLCLTVLPFRVLGDEGMFLPDTLNRLPLEKLKKRGLKIPLTEIYNPNGVSIKDAVVIIDGGTGEFVSPEGLLLTNHHVAFEALVSASSQANDYGAKGFVAKTRAEELPAKGYNVTITQELKDVTSEILNGVSETMPPAESNRAIQAKSRAMESSVANHAEG